MHVAVFCRCTFIILVQSCIRPKQTSIYFSFCSSCSRQRYMLGDGAMLKMARSNVFLSGLGGLGVEIGKCEIVFRKTVDILD